LELALSQEVYEYLEELDEMNWSARGDVLNQYLSSTSIGTTVRQNTLINILFSSGGLTNHLFVCSLPDTKANPVNINKVLLRLYGAFYSDMSDSTVRMMEECIICGLLAEKNMGPDLYGIFPEGRLEQFIPDVSILKCASWRH
jgi:hypothetical protein